MQRDTWYFNIKMCKSSRFESAVLETGVLWTTNEVNSVAWS